MVGDIIALGVGECVAVCGWGLWFFFGRSYPAGWPGVARRQLTFFASPKKVSKERRPQVRRPSRAAHRNTGTTGRFAKLGLGTTCAKGWVPGSSSNMRTGLPRSSLYCSATLMGTLRSKTSCATFVTESWRRQPAKKSFALHSVIPAQAGIQVAFELVFAFDSAFAFAFDLAFDLRPHESRRAMEG